MDDFFERQKSFFCTSRRQQYTLNTCQELKESFNSDTSSNHTRLTACSFASSTNNSTMDSKLRSVSMMTSNSVVIIINR